MCLSVTGCGSGRLKTYPVEGKVVFANGTPVKVGTIECKSTEHGVQATGTISRDGTFKLTTYEEGDGAVAGSHQCVIVQFVQTEDIPNYKPSSLGVVNPKHSSYATSGLAFEVPPNALNQIVLQVEGIARIAGEKAGSHGHEQSHEEPGSE